MERWRCYIGLTSEEQQLFDILNGVVKRYNLNTTVRVAGGWVRDKLLGRDNHDIDIALDDMTGLPFATHVNNYLAEQNFEVHRIGVIERNPEQSKHLETATVKILDMPIDFVNLRAEEYTEESRIPTVVSCWLGHDALVVQLTPVTDNSASAPQRKMLNAVISPLTLYFTM